ncbi:MAG TPA: ChrR family anti-sigma-E factor [Devosiaceae bacterium]
MTFAHHPDIATLMAFSAGTLDEAFALVVSAHVSICDQCRHKVRGMAAIGGALLQSETGIDVSEGLLDSLLQAADEVEPEAPEALPETVDLRVPVPLARYVGRGLDAVRWRFSGPGVWTAELPVGRNANSRLLLLKVAAGRKVPEHSHGGQELTLILQGAYRDRFGRFGAGDLADHDEDVEHQPIAEPGDDCICLVALDAPLSFRGRIVRALQPLIGL